MWIFTRDHGRLRVSRQAEHISCEYQNKTTKQGLINATKCVFNLFLKKKEQSHSFKPWEHCAHRSDFKAPLSACMTSIPAKVCYFGSIRDLLQHLALFPRVYARDLNNLKQKSETVQRERRKKNHLLWWKLSVKRVTAHKRTKERDKREETQVLRYTKLGEQMKAQHTSMGQGHEGCRVRTELRNQTISISQHTWHVCDKTPRLWWGRFVSVWELFGLSGAHMLVLYPPPPIQWWVWSFWPMFLWLEVLKTRKQKGFFGFSGMVLMGWISAM